MNDLRGAVFSKFQSIAAFSRAMNWDRPKASRIVNRRVRPTANEMEKMAEVLGITEEATFIRIFFPSLFHNVGK